MKSYRRLLLHNYFADFSISAWIPPKLESIPESIGNLKQIAELDLSDNRVSRLSEELKTH